MTQVAPFPTQHDLIEAPATARVLSRAVFLSSKLFALSWFGLLLFHLVCIGLYGLWGYCHVSIAASADLYTLYTFGMIQSELAFAVVGAMFTLFAVVHAVALGVMVVMSVQSRRLTFRVGFSRKCCRRCLFPSSAPGSFRRTLSIHLVEAYSTVILFYPDELFLGQQAVKIVLVSLRAYRFSQWQSHSPHLRAYVTLLLISCWVTPFLSRAWRASKASRRLMCHLVDMCVDISITLALPALLAWPHLPIFGRNVMDFITSAGDDRNAIFMNDILQRNALQGVAQTWFDVTNTAIFSVLLVMQTIDVKSIMHNRQWTIGRLKLVSEKDFLESSRMRKTRVCAKVLRVIGILWGFMLLIAHVVTEVTPIFLWCAAQGSPWFSQRVRCLSIDYFCEAYGLANSYDDLTGIIDRLDTSYTKFLDIRDCRGLDLPPAIQQLSHIVDFSVHNSTISKWEVTAALSAAFQPHLELIRISETSLAEFPSGLCCTENLPLTLLGIWFHGTNLTSLPDDLDHVWRTPFSISLENNDFDSIPPVLARLPVAFVWLSKNALTEIPDAFLVKNGSREYIDLSWNPITSLPLYLPALEDEPLPGIDVSFSSLERLPPWITRTSVLIASGTPFCDEFAYMEDAERAGNLSLAGMGYAEELLVSGFLVC